MHDANIHTPKFFVYTGITGAALLLSLLLQLLYNFLQPMHEH